MCKCPYTYVDRCDCVCKCMCTCVPVHYMLSPDPPQNFPRVFKGGEEQARELNLLEDWG